MVSIKACIAAATLLCRAHTFDNVDNVQTELFAAKSRVPTNTTNTSHTAFGASAIHAGASINVSGLREAALVGVGDATLAAPLRTRYDNKCLTVASSGDNPDISLAECDGTSNQQFFIDQDNYLRSKAGTLCADYAVASGNVEMHACHGGNNQKWKFDAGGRLLTDESSSKCLDYNTGGPAAGMHDCHTGNNQKWFWASESDTKALYFPIMSRYDNTCLEYFHTDNSKNIHLAACNGGDQQLWYINSDSQLQSKKQDGNCADYENGGSNVNMHACHTGNNQKWYLDGEIMKTKQDSKCLDYSTANGNAIMYDCNDGSQNQKWYWPTVLKATPLTTQQDGKCLGFNSADGNNPILRMLTCSEGSLEQQFYISPDMHMRSLKTDLCVDYENSGKVHMWACHGESNQKWVIENGALKTKKDSSCLAYDTGTSEVKMANCDDAAVQKWSWAPPTPSPTPRPTAAPTTPAPTPSPPPCEVTFYEHWASDKDSTYTGSTYTVEGTGTKKLDGWGRTDTGAKYGASSVKVSGKGCKVYGFKSEDCSGEQTKPITSATQLDDLPAGVVSPDSALKEFWGCNDCVRCVRVDQDN